MRCPTKRCDREMVCGFRLKRKQQRPKKSFVDSAGVLHFSLTSGFSRVSAQAGARSRLNGFDPPDAVITGLKFGVNKPLSLAHSVIWLPLDRTFISRCKTG